MSYRNRIQVEWGKLYERLKASGGSPYNFFQKELSAHWEEAGGEGAPASLMCFLSHMKQEAAARGEELRTKQKKYGHAYWQHYEEEAAQSGLSQRAYWQALPEGKPSLGYVYSRLRRRRQEILQIKSTEAVRVFTLPEGLGLGEEKQGSTRITMELPGGCRVSFMSGDPEHSLVKMVLELQEAGHEA